MTERPAAAPALLHAAAARGFARSADVYARGRPDYPPALAGWLRDAVGIGPGARVADVGAGTGKFTSLLTATGARVLAVEPLAQMRARIAPHPRLEVRAGTAQALPVADAALDAIACATAFHWFATRATLDEFARALKTGGRLLLVWNVRDESPDWVARLTALLAPHEGDAFRQASGEWRRAFPHPVFGPLEEAVFANEHVGPPQQVIVERTMSVSFVAALPEAARAQVRAQLAELIETHPLLRGQAEVRFPYRTHAYWCVRR